MFSWLTNAWRVPELRHRVLFTAMILGFYRLGSWIPVPGVNSDAIDSYFSGQGGTILGLLNIFSGGALGQFALFALGIMPYVTASIILQLMTVVIPRLEQLQKEGEAGYAKINQYTRYLTVVLAALQAAGYSYLFNRQIPDFELNPGRFVLIVVSLTAATTLLMWMGELITKRGIGNGISLLIFASILSSLPAGIRAWYEGGPYERVMFPVIALSVIVAVVFVQEGQRRIPIQYAKRMVGRRMTSGGSTYMPLRVNMAGVIPIIFAAAIMAFPPTVAQFFPKTQSFINEHFTPTDWTYLLLQALLIVIFTYFYTAVQFNPIDQADNLRKYGGYIPGIRPGPPTAQYLDRVLTRLTLPGSLYLALVATLPTLIILYGGFSQATSRALGGTSILIVVGVALDTMRQMESQMMMRHYEGFLNPLFTTVVRAAEPVASRVLVGPYLPGTNARLHPCGSLRAGAGKGTQAKRISAEAGIPHIATGDMLREAMDNATEMGVRIKPIYDAGDLVPDDQMIELIRERLSVSDTAEGFILDGFPRTVAQAEALDRGLEEIDRELTAVLFFQVPDELAVERLHVRALQEGRTDDTPEIIRHRLEVFHKRTEPVVEYYRSRGILVGIHAERPIDAVFAEVQEVLETASTHQ